MVKIKNIKNQIEDGSDFQEIFNQLLNLGDNVNMNVCYPKYLNMEESIEKYLKLIEFLAKSYIESYYPEFDKHKNDLLEYAKVKKERLKTVFEIKFSKYILDYSILPESQTKEFAKAYKAMKEENIMKDAFKVCEVLTQHRKYIDVKDIQMGFIHNIVGELNILPFVDLDFKELLLCLESVKQDYINSSNAEEAKKADSVIQIILLFMQKMYVISKALVDEYLAPDIDVDELIRHIMGSIDKIKKYVPRCGKAFSRLQKATDLLKDNFTTYYADFLESGNKPNIILDNFIWDVMGTLDDDNTELLREFREIMKFINEHGDKATKNPQCAAFMKQTNDLLDMLMNSKDIMGVKREEKDEQINKLKHQFMSRKKPK